MTVLPFGSDQYRDTPIDLFIETPFDFDTEWSQAYLQELAPHSSPLRFASLSTLIAMKEHSGRAQDLADIEQLRWIQENESKDA